LSIQGCGSVELPVCPWCDGELRRERTRLKMTQEQLAEKAALNIRTVQKIEAGNRNILVSTADRLRAALGISRNRLLAR
jgi:transcriptional regulator with XRE-family HTH domain